MKILYWGTPEYAVPTLLALHAAGHEIVGVVTQPDRRRGRGKQLMPSAIKVCAQSLELAVFTPERIKTDVGCQKELANLKADVSVVVAFGQILPKSVLEQPPLGCWNGHGSLLPRWRGAGPIQWALLEGDSETGVGIMAMEEGLDTGPVLLEQRLPISLDQNSHDLGEKLSQLTATLMVEAVDLILKAGVGTEPERLERLNVRYQGKEMSYARMLKKEDFQIKQMEPVLNEAMSKRGIDLKTLQPGSIESATGEARQSIHLQEGIDRELAKKITTLVKQSKVKVQASIQGESIRINGKKRDELQQIIQLIKDQKYGLPLQFDNFRD